MLLKTVVRALLAALLYLPYSVIAQPDYIGEQQCQSCHQAESQQWQGSHHQQAMQIADDSSVLGDFSGVSFSKEGVTTRFFKDQGRFMVNTDGANGEMQDFEISYVFGVFPLQQYMVKFPGGRIQVLDIAWDTRDASEGGQRWYSLHPNDKISAGDVLHWTGPNLNWNYMCADCHSTNLQKNYDSKSDSYKTSWSEMNVSCEACHGPGSAHQSWAQSAEQGKPEELENKGLTVLLDEREGVTWPRDETSGLPHRSRPNTERKEIEVCARCHSRRGQLSEDFVPGQPFMNAYHPALLTDGLYYADGQMQDEVYVWGSFRQSKMYQAGVSCSDCHNPHSGELKAPQQQVCAQCHAPATYASPKHHFHEADSPGGNCIACHMPATTLMGVDERNDHSFRIPRPDLSASLGMPNACTQCHLGKTANWGADSLQKWYGRQPKGYQQFALALTAARIGERSAAARLQALAMNPGQAGIARATAFSEMGNQLDQASLIAIQQGLNDEDPLVRQGALSGLESAPMQYRIMALPSVWDDVLAVRIQAARMLASYPADQLRADRKEKLDTVLAEYIQTQQFNGERPESQLNLGSLYQELGRLDEAEHAYRLALQRQPQFVPAYVNLAQLLGSLGRVEDATAVYQQGLEQVPEDSAASLYHAQGLAQVRQKQMAAALLSLQKAAELDALNQRYQYVYAVALQSAGQLDSAIAVLQRVLQQSPGSIDILYALATFSRDAGQHEAALDYALKLQTLLPDDPQIKQLVTSLQSSN